MVGLQLDGVEGQGLGGVELAIDDQPEHLPGLHDPTASTDDPIPSTSSAAWDSASRASVRSPVSNASLGAVP